MIPQQIAEVGMQFRRSPRVKASLFAGIVSSAIVGGLCTIVIVGNLQVYPFTAACTYLLLTYLYICVMFRWLRFDSMKCPLSRNLRTHLTLICS